MQQIKSELIDELHEGVSPHLHQSLKELIQMVGEESLCYSIEAGRLNIKDNAVLRVPPVDSRGAALAIISSGSSLGSDFLYDDEQVQKTSSVRLRS